MREHERWHERARWFGMGGFAGRRARGGWDVPPGRGEGGPGGPGGHGPGHGPGGRGRPWERWAPWERWGGREPGGDERMPGGPGGWRGRMERGVLRYLLLGALSDGPKHGYELIKWLEERSHGLYTPSPGTVYPTLQLMDDQGLVRAECQEERRVYHLTDAGRAELGAHADVVEAVWARFAGRAPSDASRHQAGFLQDELNDLTRTVWSGLRHAIRQGDDETVRRVRSAIERCKNEVRDLIAHSAPGGGPGAGAAGPAGDAPTGERI